MNLYLKNRHLMDTGDILQWHSKTAIGWIIRKFTKSEFNHTSIVVRPYGRIMILEALENGVHDKPVSDRFKTFKGDVYWCKLKPEFDIYRRSIGYNAYGLIGTEYDFGSLFKQAIMRVSAEANKLFCSETAYIAIKRSSLPIPNDPKYAPRPSDIEEMGCWEPGIKILTA